MTNLNSLPEGLQERVAEANRLLAQSSKAEVEGYHEIAVIKAKEGLAVLKQVSSLAPELGAVLLAGVMGHKGIEINETEVKTSYQAVERKFLGLSMGTDYLPQTTTRRYYRQIKLI